MQYSGFTIVLSSASRHDKEELISGYAGSFFWSIIIPLHRENIDLRTVETKEPYLPGTKVVLLLGQKSLDLLNTNERLDIVHGYPIIQNDIVFIPTFAPQDAFDRSNYFGEEEDTPAESEDTSAKTSGRTQRKNYRFWLYQNVKKALRIFHKGINSSFMDPFEYMLYPSAENIIVLLRETKNSLLFIDIETDKNLNLTCLGFSFLSGAVYVVPWKLYTGQLAYNENESLEIIRSLIIAFRDNTIVAHNSMFDLFVMALKYKVPFPRKIFDTMLGFSRCYPEVEKSLARCVSFFTDMPYHKSEGIYDPKSSAQQDSLWKYNAKDVETTKMIYGPILEEAKKLHAESSIQQVNESIRPYLTIMFQGIRLDVEKMKVLYEDFHRRYEIYCRCLDIVTNKEDFNPRSPKQVEEYLYGELLLEKPSKDATNERQLLKILTKKNIPSIKLILAARSCGKAASSLKFQTWLEDRTTTGYRLAGTETFRLSSKALLKFPPDQRGYGGNLQNIDKDKIGEIYIPDKSKIFVKVDQAGAEAKIVAYLCRNGRYRSLFLFNIKPHIYMSLVLFAPFWEQVFSSILIKELLSLSIEKLSQHPRWKEVELAIKKDTEKYYIAKKTVHSASYGIKSPTLQLSILLDSNGSIAPTIGQCREWLGNFHNTFPEIESWQCETREKVTKFRRLENLFRFPRLFHQPQSDELWKSAYAFVPQSTVGSITNIAVTKLQEHIEKDRLSIDVLLNEHDSYLLQCNENKTEECIKLGREFMEQKLTNFLGEPFQMGTGVSVGMNLKEMKEL